MGKRIIAAALVTGAAAFAAAPVWAGSAKPQQRKVKIGDNFYSPSKLTVNYGSTVTWVWPDDIGDTHNVTLRKGPTGVKKFHSDDFAVGATYKRRFTKPGVYRIWCTLHSETMRMTITVRKKPKSTR